MKLLKAQNIILFVIALAMLNNVEHLAWVHHSISRLSFASDKLNWIHSIVVVIILEIVIIVLVHFGLKKFAGFYTFMLLCLQLIYYPIDEYWQSGEYGKLAASIIYSVMFTISVYYFSVMRANKSDGNVKADEYKQRFYSANSELELVKRELKTLETEMHSHEDTFNSYQSEIEYLKSEIKSHKSDLNEKETELQQYRTEFLKAERSRILKKKEENRTEKELAILAECEMN